MIVIVDAESFCIFDDGCRGEAVFRMGVNGHCVLFCRLPAGGAEDEEPQREAKTFYHDWPKTYFFHSRLIDWKQFLLFTRKRKMTKGCWQVFWLALLSDTFPSLIGQWYADRTNGPYGELTATGIAPDLHRTSLLMAPCANQNLCEDINRYAITADWTKFVRELGGIRPGTGGNGINIAAHRKI